jgi:tetratricopeptide (TPR) repeat protein
LEREIELHNDPRDIFYCAQSYANGQDLGKALRMYERRVACETDENAERWCAQLRVADLKALLGAPSVDVEAEFRRAIAMRPGRNEPYMGLAKHLNTQGRYAEALPWAVAAIWQRPTSDRLFVDAPSWTWKPRIEAGVSMAMLGRPSEAKALWLQALNAKPNAEACAGLMRNLQQVDRVLEGLKQLPLGEKTPGVEMELARYLREQAELSRAA